MEIDEENIFKKYGVGRRNPDDPFFCSGNIISGMAAREGVIDSFEESEKR